MHAGMHAAAALLKSQPKTNGLPYFYSLNKTTLHRPLMMFVVVVDVSLFRRGGGKEQPKYFLRAGGEQQ